MSSRTIRACWLLIVPLSLGLVAPNHAEVVTIGSVKDNTAYEPNLGPLSNGIGQYMFSGRNPAGHRRRAFVQFDVAGAIPAGSTITSVQLTLNLSRTTAGPQIIYLHKVLASWGEGSSNAITGGGGQGAPATPGDLTWSCRFFPDILWNAQGGDFVGTASGSTVVDFLGFYTWNSTPGMVADVQSWLSNPAGNFGWALVGNEGVIATTKRFDTRENESPGNRPKLFVTYQPPGACACPADMNGDALRSGLDIQGFVACLLGGGANCGCADVNGGGLDATDVAAFVDAVLAGADCP